MYTWEYANLVRSLERHLFSGPETVEHIFERDDDFQAPRIRRRDIALAVGDDQALEGMDLWYTQTYDSATDTMVYTFPTTSSS